MGSFWKSSGGSAAIAAGGSFLSGLAGGLFAGRQQRRQYKLNLKLQKQQQDWQRQMWEMQNMYNLPKNELRRLLDAGINPALAFSNGGAAAAPVPQSGSAGGVSAPTADFGNAGAAAVNAALQTESVQSQNDLNKALAVKAEKEGDAALANAGLSDVRARAESFDLDIKQQNRDVIVGNLRLQYDFSRLNYAMGYNAYERDRLYTRNYSTILGQQITQGKLNLSRTQAAIDHTFADIDLLVARKELTQQQAANLRIEAQILLCDKYFAEWSKRFQQILRDSVYGKNFDSSVMQDVISTAKNHLVEAYQRSQTGLISAAYDYGYEVSFGLADRYYGFENNRRSANQKRTSMYTSVIGSISGAAQMAIGGVAARSANQYRGALIKSLNRTNRNFGAPLDYYGAWEPSPF